MLFSPISTYVVCMQNIAILSCYANQKIIHQIR